MVIAQYSVSVERPCPLETVIFTCTVTGSSMRWDPSDIGHITVRADTANLNVSTLPVPGYTVTLTAFTDTTITSTLSRTAEDGISVECADLPTGNTIGSTTISLAGKLLQLYTSMINKCFNH